MTDPYASLGTPTTESPPAAGADPYVALGTPADASSSAPDQSYLQKKLQQNIGVADATLHYARGTVAPFVGGLEYLGSLALGRGTDQALADKNAIENTVTGTPLTAAGNADVNAVNGFLAPVAETAGKVVNAASDTAAEYGGPAAGAATKTLLQGAPYILGGLNPLRSVLGIATTSDAAAAAASSAAARAAYGAPELTGTAADDTVGAAAQTPPKYEAAPPPVNGQPTEPPTELPKGVQAQREQTLAEIGLTKARDSAITGDKKAAATDYQTAKLDNSAGQKTAAAFAQERAALDNYADRLVSDAGGSAGLDENALHARGQTIMAPLEGLDDAYSARIKQLYGAADAKAQGMPVDLSKTANAIGNKPEFVGTVEGQQLLHGVNSYLRKAGIADESGNIGGATVQQAEQLKQYLNGQWTPRTGRLIRNLKDAIDDDVTSSAGSDVYGAARQLRAKRAAVLDDPQGIGSLLDSSGPEGINRKVPYESVPDKILRMPVDQFGHVVKTLQNAVDGTEQVEPELRLQAQQALSEIRSQAMLRLQEQAQRFKGAWNNRGVTQYLNQNSAKLARIFTPRELAKIRTLNDAGNILDVDRTYPGAAVQGHNLAMRGLIAAVRHGVSIGGAHIGGATGDIAGEVIGRTVASRLERTAGRAARMRALKASPAVQTEMDRVMAHPNAGKWLAGKTTGKYLRVMARLNSAADLQKAADALNRAGQRDNDQDAIDAAQAVRDAVASTPSATMTFRHFSNANGAPQRLTVNPTRVEQAGGPQVSAAYAADHPDQMVEPAHRGRPEYRITVPKSSMYDLSNDPEGIRDAATKGGVYDHSAAEQAVKQRGYTGYYTPAHANPVYRGQARFFKPVDATRKQ